MEKHYMMNRALQSKSSEFVMILYFFTVYLPRFHCCFRPQASLAVPVEDTGGAKQAEVAA